MKYNTFLNILDKIIAEAPSVMTAKYPKKPSSEDELNQARSRAFIHLYLQVSFGLLDFKERERLITDGAFDGGIDGYYINEDNKTIYFIQSKFRTNVKNFETKEIELAEILVMDINRILDGEESDEQGNSYNGKIKQLQREVSQIHDIARYKYKVIILANLFGRKDSDLKKLTGGFDCEVFNFEQCYTKLVFPIITGTYFNASDLNINIDLSNKNSGSKISYTVKTSKGEAEITVLFVPTIELARIMHKYKNSILKYNPRSYLGHAGHKVNVSIRKTILEKETNEFALFNNGITMLSDETYINERIGQKNKAQLTVKNPQIINGGQTSYTLSRIYEENIENDVETIFQDKEVLLKVITLLENKHHLTKLELIKDISEATNQQTPVITADKMANDELQIDIQTLLFERYGLLYERKRGEFENGIFNHYITNDLIMERNLFFRILFAANGNIKKTIKKRLFLRQKIDLQILEKKEIMDNTFFGYLCFQKLKSHEESLTKNRMLKLFSQVYAMTLLYKPLEIEAYSQVVNDNLEFFKNKWKDFLVETKQQYIKTRLVINKKTGEERKKEYEDLPVWCESKDFITQLRQFYEK